MRKINKGRALPEFERFKRLYSPQTWKDFNKEQRLKTKCMQHILINEQEGLSGYTERLISEDSRLVHIDHFKKRALYNTPNDIYDWRNFIVDEHKGRYGADCKDNFGLQRSDYDNLINPCEEDPNQYFEYSVNGEILPRSVLGDVAKAKAEFTIKVFGLNDKSLKEERMRLINTVMQLKEQGINSKEIVEWFGGEPYPSVIEYFLLYDY